MNLMGKVAGGSDSNEEELEDEFEARSRAKGKCEDLMCLMYSAVMSIVVSCFYA
jgi:hypothetical protein